MACASGSSRWGACRAEFPPSGSRRISRPRLNTRCTAPSRLSAVGLIAQAGKGGAALDAAGWLFLAGSLVFSGSLYVLCMTGEKWLGMITPIGGVAMLAGWIALAVAAGASWKAPAANPLS